MDITSYHPISISMRKTQLFFAHKCWFETLLVDKKRWINESRAIRPIVVGSVSFRSKMVIRILYIIFFSHWTLTVGHIDLCLVRLVYTLFRSRAFAFCVNYIVWNILWEIADLRYSVQIHHLYCKLIWSTDGTQFYISWIHQSFFILMMENHHLRLKYHMVAHFSVCSNLLMLVFFFSIHR